MEKKLSILENLVFRVLLNKDVTEKLIIGLFQQVDNLLSSYENYTLNLKQNI